MARDIYIAIMVAAARGVGVRLSVDEVAQLSCDDAISLAAMNELEESEWPGWADGREPNWLKISPTRKRRPANLTCFAPEDRP